MGEPPVIFVVDDDDVVRDSLKVLLELRNYRVHDFGSAAAFLAARAEAVEPATCLVLDIHMPDMTGIELLRRLRSEGDRTPAILITGRRDPATQAQAQSLGVTALLDKPISHPALFSAIEQALKPP
ncbi:MAG: response regulator [Alphaproteobacteria bacterium]|nr:response regulator [Alphaproteobacteria bacterium]